MRYSAAVFAGLVQVGGWPDRCCWVAGTRWCGHALTIKNEGWLAPLVAEMSKSIVLLAFTAFILVLKKRKTPTPPPSNTKALDVPVSRKNKKNKTKRVGLRAKNRTKKPIRCYGNGSEPRVAGTGTSWSGKGWGAAHLLPFQLHHATHWLSVARVVFTQHLPLPENVKALCKNVPAKATAVKTAAAAAS